MEATDILSGRNALYRVTVLIGNELAVPLQFGEVSRIQDVDNRIRIQRPAIHIGVQTFIGYGAEQERLTCFPRLAGYNPLGCGSLKVRIGRVLLQRAYFLQQYGHFVFQIQVSRKYHVIYISFYDFIQNGIIIYVFLLRDFRV